MLTQYQTDLRNLLQNPSASPQLYATDSLNRWINIARGQVAGEGECIRNLATIDTVVGQRAYLFSDLNTGAGTGIREVIHVRQVSVAAGAKNLNLRNWEWFFTYLLNKKTVTNGVPTQWAQFAQGAGGAVGVSGSSGSFYIDPPPDAVYTLTCDCVCYPIELVDDTTIEAIPYLWTDSVPFFAAYYAYLSSQTGARQADAERMFAHYQTFLERARKAANSSVNRWMFEQASDPTQVNKLGLSPKQAGVG